jgi:DNA-binding MarR family transcriptional regulator
MLTSMARTGADLALLLLGGFRALADAASEELGRRGYSKIRPVHDFAIRSIDAGADTAAELGRQLGVSKQAAAKTLAFLEEHGYVVGQVDTRDSRRRRFRVTDRGHELLSTGEQVFDDLRIRWAERIGVQERERLEEALADLGIRIPNRADPASWLENT